MQEHVYLHESGQLDGSMYKTEYICVRLGADGSCTYITGDWLDYAMLETYGTLHVHQGQFSESEGVITLTLTSKFRFEDETDEYGLSEASRSPTQTIDEAVVMEREGDAIRVGEHVLALRKTMPRNIASALFKNDTT